MDKNSIINEYIKTDKSKQEICDEFQITYDELFEIISEFNYNVIIDVELRKYVAELYNNSDYTINEIANITGVSKHSINIIVKKHGLKPRKQRFIEESIQKTNKAVQDYKDHPEKFAYVVAKENNISTSSLYRGLNNEPKRIKISSIFDSNNHTKSIPTMIDDNDNFYPIDITEYDNNKYTKALFYTVIYSRTVRLYKCNITDINSKIFIIRVKRYDNPKEDELDINYNPEVAVCTNKEHVDELTSKLVTLFENNNIKNIHITVNEYEYSNRFFKLISEFLDRKF